MFARHFSRLCETPSLIPSCLLRPFSLSVLAAFALATSARAGMPVYHLPYPTEALLAQRAIADTDTARATNPVQTVVAVPDSAIVKSDSTSTSPGDSVAIALPPPRQEGDSMGKAVLFDALIPGSGHLYAGYQSGWVNLGVEGLTWVAYFYYHGQGATKENEYIAFANSNWSYDTWLGSGCTECYAGSDADSLIRYFQEHNTQHYYEDIGKLSTYFEGWDDYNLSNQDSADRRYYRGMRNDSNKDLHNAQYALMVGFVNRIVAVVDIVRLMKKAPKVDMGNGTSLNFNVHTKPFNTENAFGVRITKKI